ncbi:DinB family protein [Virgibacillus sp. MG-45]|uniref:DinB family protein n=1 Tax=Virgibacillus sp. MG-45 TaxID=3102791 RepID=UPI002EDB8100
MNNALDEKLRETRNKLLNEFSFISDTQFNMQPDEDTWSVAQVCHHLVLTEEATINAVKWGLSPANHEHTEPKNIHLILDRTRKVSAPKVVTPAVEAFTVDEMIDLFNQSREKLLTFLASIEDTPTLKQLAVKHPFFGKLPLD